MILEPKKIKSDTVSTVSPSICHEVMGPDAMILGDVKDLDWEDPLEEGMATQSSILAWRIPMERGAWQATIHRVPKSRTLK